MVKGWDPSEVFSVLTGDKKRKAFVFASLSIEMEQKEKERKEMARS
ncbi:hypothetical protein [Alkalicoccobacillus gibsonii]|nr:hypothetical protein [Alkalicoccobacillus gibsonii]